MTSSLCFNTPVGNGCIGVADKTVGIILCFTAIGIFVAGLAMLSQKE